MKIVRSQENLHAGGEASTSPSAEEKTRRAAGKPSKPKTQLERVVTMANAMLEKESSDAKAPAKKSAKNNEPYSRLGPHPSEWKRREGAPTSSHLERVAKRAIVLRPSSEDSDVIKALQSSRSTRDATGILARHSAKQIQEAFALTDELVQELRDKSWELREVAYMPGDDLGFMRLLESVSVVVVAIPLALQGGDLLELLRKARAKGIIVMQSNKVGHFLAHDRHVDISETDYLPPKRLPARRIGLEDRCETRDDGYREIVIHVISMPGTGEERTTLRERVMPILQRRCRSRRLRLKYVDLKDMCPGAGPGQAVNALAHAMKIGGLFVVLLSAKHEIDWYGSVRMREYVQIMRAEGQREAETDVTWMRNAPNDYSRVETQLGQLLRVFDDLDESLFDDSVDLMHHLTLEERRQVAQAKVQRDTLRVQHVMAYHPKRRFYEKLRATKDPDFVSHLVSADLVQKERLGSLLSTLYAHAGTSITEYSALFAPPVKEHAEGNFTNVQRPPRSTGLAEFADTLLKDLWSRISIEFPTEEQLDETIRLVNVEPELSLSEKLPFYAHRAMEEKILLKAIKTGRPAVTVIQGAAGAGITSMLQYSARLARSLFHQSGQDGPAEKIAIVSDYGALEGRMDPTPAQILRNIVKQLKMHFSFDDFVPATTESVRSLLLTMLRRITRAHGRALIFIDALHLVHNPTGAAWLPSEDEIPIGVQFFVGIERVAEHQVLEEENHDHRRMPALDFNLIASFRRRMLELQHIALRSSCPKAAKQSITLETLRYEERRAYAQHLLRPYGIRITNQMVMQMMDKPCTATFRGLNLMCERIMMSDPYSDPAAKYLTSFPKTEREHYHQILKMMEKLFSLEILACVLPVIALGCKCLTRTDVAHMVRRNVIKSANVYELLDNLMIPLLWAARFFIKGDAYAGSTSSASGKLYIEGQVACDVILERYVPKEQQKRRVYQMIVAYFDRNVNGAGLLSTIQSTASLKAQGLDPFARDEDGRMANEVMYQEHEMAVNTILYLPYFCTQARMFDRLADLLKDVEFLQAKLVLQESQALIEDFDRILPQSGGPERPLWISQHLAVSEGLVDVPGMLPGIDGRIQQLAIYNSHCLGFHVEAYQFYVSQTGDHATMKTLAALRDVLWRNIESLHRRPALIRQVFFNDIGDAAPRLIASGGIIEPSESAIRDSTGNERIMLKWENKPSSQVVSNSMSSGYELEGSIRCVIWLDEVTFCAGYASGAVEVWDTLRGEVVARLLGHERAITTLALLNHDEIKNARKSIFIVSGSRDKTVRIWRLDDSLGHDCDTLYGHTEAISSVVVATAINELFSAAGNEIRCWSCSPGYPLLYLFDTDYKSPLSSISLSPDLSYMVTAFLDGTMRVWAFTLAESASSMVMASRSISNRGGQRDDLSGAVSIPSNSMIGGRRMKFSSTPPNVSLELRGHLAEVTCTACSVDGMFASASMDSSIMLWDPKTGKHVGMLKGNDGPLTDIKFSRDGKLLVSSSFDRTCRVFHTRTGKVVHTLRHLHRVSCCDISTDSSCVVTGATDGNIRVWNWLGHQESASSGALPRGSGLLRRAPETKANVGSEADTHASEITACCSMTIPGGKSCFVTSDSEGCVRVTDESNWTCISEITPLKSKGIASEVTFEQRGIMTMDAFANDSIVYFGRIDGSLTAWDFGANTWAWPKSHVVEAHTRGVYSMTHMDRSTLITGGGGGNISVWDVGGRSPTLMKTFAGHESRVRGLCADSTGLYSVGGDKRVKSWDIERDTVSEFIAHDAIIVDCALSPSGLITLGAEGLVKLWDARVGTEAARISLPPGIPISCNVIVDQPHWLPVLTDSALCVYDVRKLNEIATFTNIRAQTRCTREASLSAVAFNPSGTRAALCDALGRLCGLTTSFISSRPS